MKTIVIIGCGGVGSNLAYMLTKTNRRVDKIILIDHDTIDEGNLNRQMFSKADVGVNKAHALANMLRQFRPDITYESFDLKIETEVDLQVVPYECSVFVCTDNMASKRLVQKTKDQRRTKWMIDFVGCEEDYFDVRPRLEKEDYATWSLESGYNSSQTARSNMSAAFMLYAKWDEELVLPEPKKVSLLKITRHSFFLSPHIPICQLVIDDKTPTKVWIPVYEWITTPRENFDNTIGFLGAFTPEIKFDSIEHCEFFIRQVFNAPKLGVWLSSQPKRVNGENSSKITQKEELEQILAKRKNKKTKEATT